MQTPTEVSTGEAKHDSSASRLEMVKTWIERSPSFLVTGSHSTCPCSTSWPLRVVDVSGSPQPIWKFPLDTSHIYGNKVKVGPWTTNLHAHLRHVSLFWTTSLESLRFKGPCWAVRSICGWRGGPFCFSTVYQVAEITKGCLEVIDRWQSSLKPEIFGNIWEYRACNLTVLESCSPFFTSSNKAQWQIRAKARLLEQAVERCPVMSDTLRPC